jgi:K+-sensing histidine kinase KdpD
MWTQFFRGQRHVAAISGSGLGLWIAGAFVAANVGTVTAASGGPNQGSSISIELPVAQGVVSQMEADADE